MNLKFFITKWSQHLIMTITSARELHKNINAAITFICCNTSYAAERYMLVLYVGYPFAKAKCDIIKWRGGLRFLSLVLFWMIHQKLCYKAIASVQFVLLDLPRWWWDDSVYDANASQDVVCRGNPLTDFNAISTRCRSSFIYGNLIVYHRLSSYQQTLLAE